MKKGGGWGSLGRLQIPVSKLWSALLCHGGPIQEKEKKRPSLVVKKARLRLLNYDPRGGGGGGDIMRRDK
jgi:hypothetical protein